MRRWQEALGLELVTDGEFRRESWRLGFVSKVAGFARADAVGDVDLQPTRAPAHRRRRSRLAGASPAHRPDRRRRSRLPLGKTKRTVKATLPAPSYLHYPRGRTCVDPDVYPDLEEFFDDVVGVYVAELKALHAAGGRYLQIDEVAQTLLCDQRLRDAVHARGDDPERLVDLYIDLINRIVRARPAGMTIGVHMCRGNAHGKWIAAGGYERIAEKALPPSRSTRSSSSSTAERAGGFEPLRFVPGGKTVVLGLVSTKIAGRSKRRRPEAAHRGGVAFVPLERLAISPQCGFSGHFEPRPLAPEDQRRKLARVIEVAHEVWKS